MVNQISVYKFFVIFCTFGGYFKYAGGTASHWTDYNRLKLATNWQSGSVAAGRYHSRNEVDRFSDQAPKTDYYDFDDYVPSNTRKNPSHWNDNRYDYDHNKGSNHNFKDHKVTNSADRYKYEVTERRSHPNNYPVWTHGVYKTHQRGSVNIPFLGASVNVSPNEGSKKAHRGIITATILSPNESRRSKVHGSGIEAPAFVHDQPQYISARRPKENSPCVICPEERTVIANKKKDKVILERPILKSCDGEILNSEYEFKIIFGPQFGNLLSSGSHVIVGKILKNGKALQTCQLRVNVIVRKCPELTLPPNMKAECDSNNIWGSECQISCINPRERIRQKGELYCNDELKWNNDIPLCVVYSSCELPTAPEHSKISCNTLRELKQKPSKGIVGKDDLPEGTRCRVQCDPGYKLTSRRGSVAKCLAGDWTRKLTAVCRIPKSSKEDHNISQ